MSWLEWAWGATILVLLVSFLAIMWRWFLDDLQGLEPELSTHELCQQAIQDAEDLDAARDSLLRLCGELGIDRTRVLDELEAAEIAELLPPRPHVVRRWRDRP